MDGRRLTAAQKKQRRSRLAAGGVATPLSFIAAYAFKEVMGKDMPTELSLAVYTLIGLLVGVGTICFWDIRAIILAWIHRDRRDPDPEYPDP